MARRTKKTYTSVILNVTSSKPATQYKLKGILSAQSKDVNRAQTGEKVAEVVDEFTFEEVGDDKSMIIVGERKWIPIKANKQYGIRVTKNKETGEYRILCHLTREKLQTMTLRDVGELEAELGLMIERIRL